MSTSLFIKHRRRLVFTCGGGRRQTDLLSLGGSDGQGVGHQQRCVLLLHNVDAGDWNHNLQQTDVELPGAETQQSWDQRELWSGS